MMKNLLSQLTLTETEGKMKTKLFLQCYDLQC